MLINIPRIPIKEIILFGLLPSFLKKLVYKFKGYRIGNDVSMGLGSVIIGKNVTIGAGTKIGFLTVIRGKRIQIGSRVTVGIMTIFDTPHLEIGDDAVINEQVVVGGVQFPESKFILGANTTVMQRTYINTARPVVVGDDSGIGGDCLLFTHGSWLSQFEGYPVKYAPIEIGKSVWLPWRVFVMPGTKIGDGSVIGANSVVSSDIPPNSLAAGTPAKIIRQAPDFPTCISDDEKVRILENILLKMIEYFKFHGILIEKRDNVYEFVHTEKSWFGSKKKTWMMRIVYGKENEKERSLTKRDCDLYLSLYRISGEVRISLVSREIMWLDIEKKERSKLANSLGEEVASFLYRYGVRFTRV